MSIKIDEATQKAVDPESIGKGMIKRLLLAMAVVALVAVGYKVL